MIIDKDKRFIFVHNPRTGGTSIKKVLSKYQDEDLIQKVRDFVKEETNFNHILYSHENHINLSLKFFTSDFLKDYKYIFTCVRNPFSRTYSYYNKLIGSAKKSIDFNNNPFGVTCIEELPSFETWINDSALHFRGAPPGRWGALHLFPYNFWLAGAHGVYRLEDLSSEKVWNDLLHNCGIKEKISRPHENRSYKDSPWEYREAYTADMCFKIHTMFQDEINFYKYEF